MLDADLIRRLKRSVGDWELQILPEVDAWFTIAILSSHPHNVRSLQASSKTISDTYVPLAMSRITSLRCKRTAGRSLLTRAADVSLLTKFDSEQDSCTLLFTCPLNSSHKDKLLAQETLLRNPPITVVVCHSTQMPQSHVSALMRG